MDNLSMVIAVPTLKSHPNWDKWPQAWHDCSSSKPPVVFADGSVGVLAAMQDLYERTTEDIICLLHDDVEAMEQGWDLRVLAEFADPTVGLVGFGGAIGLGTDDIYKTPYRLQQLARVGYRSNVIDAEIHGLREPNAIDVATLDGFALIVRRRVLDLLGGMPGHGDRGIPHHNYDNRLCIACHKLGLRVRLVGIRCKHHGGLTSTGEKYQSWAKQTEWGSDAGIHQASHLPLYEDGRGILPLRIKQ